MPAVTPALRPPPWRDPYLLKSIAKMEFRMVAPTMPTGLPILANLTLLLHWISLKSSLPSLSRVLRLLAPLRKVRRLDPPCHLDGQRTQKELGLIVCPMMSKKMSRCSLLRPLQQRQMCTHPVFAVTIWYRNSTSVFINKVWQIVQVSVMSLVCSRGTQSIIQGVIL